MNIKAVRQNVSTTTMFAAAEADALVLLRNHVRAIDDSDDDLIKIYLDAAFDYMQSLTDRLLGTHDVTVLVDYEELEHRIELTGINDVTADGFSVKYRKEDGTYSTDILDDEATDYIDDLEYLIIRDSYPPYLYFENLRDKVRDTDSKFTKGFVKIECDAGLALTKLPRQYKQAALLLVGHYYNMREAEVIGAISMELKEGVQRLMASVRQY